MSIQQPITLAMILKNEGHIIERCLESVRGKIDRAVLIDTGSDDDTIEVASIVLESFDIPYEILEQPWVDFSFNRTALVEAARQFSDQQGYLLLLDADHVLRGEVVPTTGATSYLIKILGTPEYRMPYLVRADLPWRYISRTHEYITLDFPYENENIDSCTIEHLADGGTRHEKFERDVAFLEADYNEDPDNPRHCFYLAETYKNSGRTAEALELYRRRIGLGGFYEEVYIAWIELAQLTGSLQDYLDAWNYLPQRAEAPHFAIKLLNESGNHLAAFAIANTAMPRLQMGEHLLFVQKWIEDYAFAFEFAIAQWWGGNKVGANEIFAYLITLDIPDNYKDACRSNLACE